MNNVGTNGAAADTSSAEPENHAPATKQDFGNHPAIAAFDFDGTISTTDSLRDFVKQTVGMPRMIYGVLCALPWLLAMKLGWCDRGAAKAKFLAAIFKGQTRSELEAAAQRYATGPLLDLLRPAMLQRIHDHRKRGHAVLLVSASPTLYLKIWAQQAGFDAVLATELAFSHEQFTGTFASPNCWGPEKVRRLQQLLGQQRPATLYAYGDSRGDAEMLAFADIAWLRGRGDLPAIVN